MAQELKAQQPFSEQLSDWLKTSKDKSLPGLIKVFQEKAFAIIFLLMLALPALPIPTGGVTHVTEIIAALSALQLIVGRRILWIPGWAIRKVNVGKLLSGKGGQKLISVIQWFERKSRRRLSGLLTLRPILSLIGLIVLVYTAAAFVAPPFSGLDTLPALGVVVISLGLILEDAAIVLTGVIIGAAGIVLEITAGGALYHGITHLF
jgi:hypothetical protein